MKELLDIKYKGNHETFMDMQDRLQRQAAKIIEDQIQAEAEEAKELGDGENFMVTKASKARAKAKQEALLQEVALARKNAMANQRKRNEKKTLEKNKRKK